MKTDLELKNFYNVEFEDIYKIFGSHGKDYFNLVGKKFHLERRLNEKHGDMIIRFDDLRTYELHILDDYVYMKVDSLSRLTPKEKVYLSNVITPFKDRVLYISKCSLYDTNCETIMIKVEPISEASGFVATNTIFLPYFKAGTMYKNLIDSIRYTPAQLGL